MAAKCPADEDPALLKYEAEQAWRLMQHHADRADSLLFDLRYEIRNRDRLKIKQIALDKIYRLIRNYDGSDDPAIIDQIKVIAFKAHDAFSASEAREKARKQP